MKIGYLEIVTPDVDVVCATYERVYRVTFSEPVPTLGNARTASLPAGGRLGVRAPLREDEAPVVRPYFEVKDVQATLEAAAAEEGVIAVPAMELPGQGVCGIYLQGGIDHGVWQHTRG